MLNKPATQIFRSAPSHYPPAHAATKNRKKITNLKFFDTVNAIKWLPAVPTVRKKQHMQDKSKGQTIQEDAFHISF